MEKILTKDHIGDFFAKMHEAGKDMKVEVALRPDEGRVVIYYRDMGTFDYISIVDERQNIDELVKSLRK